MDWAWIAANPSWAVAVISWTVCLSLGAAIGLLWKRNIALENAHREVTREIASHVGANAEAAGALKEQSQSAATAQTEQYRSIAEGMNALRLDLSATRADVSQILGRLK